MSRGASTVKAVLFDLYDTLVYLRSELVEEVRRGHEVGAPED